MSAGRHLLGILPTIDRPFPSRVSRHHWSAPSGFTGILAGTYRGFPSEVFFSFVTFYLSDTRGDTLLQRGIPTYLSTYPSVSSLPPRSTHLLDLSLHVFMIG